MGLLATYVANEHGIELIGDLPIFISHHSADVWANPELFQLEENGLPTVVAGVPPDYFSETGQNGILCSIIGRNMSVQVGAGVAKEWRVSYDYSMV